MAEVRDGDVLVYNAVRGLPKWLRGLRFDAVVLHTTLLGVRWMPSFARWKRRLAWLADMDAVKVAFPQDDYSYAETLDAWLEELGVSVIGTVLDARHRNELYPRIGANAAFYDVLTGYIDEGSAQRVQSRLGKTRPHDVVYRARRLPYWLGSHGQLKHRIGLAAEASGRQAGLRCDISTLPHQVILGDAWLDFMASGRATIGAESGASALDRRGEIQREVESLLAADPDLPFDAVAAQLPAGWDDYEFFAVSPRHLEAVVTKTAQVLVEGRYSGVLEPNVHYIPVRRDLADIDEALEQLKDARVPEGIADQAYADVYRSGRYSSRRLTETLERILEEHAPDGRHAPASRTVTRLAAAEETLERVALAPAESVARGGWEARGDLLAGLRLFAIDGSSRRLLRDYLRSSETREHVTPRMALADILCLAELRKQGRLTVTLDDERRRVVLGSMQAPPATRDDLESALRADAWEFFSAHPADGTRALPLLDWLARSKPRDVAAALARP